MKTLFRIVLSFYLLSLISDNLIAQQRPNILFCLADDWGWPHAGAYGDGGVDTPSFDRLSREGMLFHNAYVTSPSCSPSRNSVVTGKYPWQLGSGVNLQSCLPVEHDSVVHILARNNYLTGYTKAKTWGPGDIRPWQEYHGAHPAGAKAYDGLADFLSENQGKEEPFFFWLGTSDPHRPYDKGTGLASGIDPARVKMFEQFPDSPDIRSDIADYYYEVQRWDALVGSAIAELEKRGLLENTIIIMTGDHGMPFPRCKGNLYDCGVRVPFVVRWGKGVTPGLEVQDFISFADIAPTLLELTGITVPADMTGRSFATVLKGNASGLVDPDNRSSVVFGRERHVPAQERPDMGGYPSRAYRDFNYLYIRNYSPQRWPAGTDRLGYTNYPDQWLADCDASPTKNYIVLNKDKDPEHSRAYELCFAKRPAQELYDVKNDLGQTHNLAADPAYSDLLAELDAKLQKELARHNDPRVSEPGYTGFDLYPYNGPGGAKIPADIKARLLTDN